MARTISEIYQLGPVVVAREARGLKGGQKP